jgi:hypothetical protein
MNHVWCGVDAHSVFAIVCVLRPACCCVVLNQDPYDNRDVFTSLDLCWELLEAFPPEELKQINPELREKFYKRDRRMAYNMSQEEKKAGH